MVVSHVRADSLPQLRSGLAVYTMRIGRLQVWGVPVVCGGEVLHLWGYLRMCVGKCGALWGSCCPERAERRGWKISPRGIGDHLMLSPDGLSSPHSSLMVSFQHSS